MTQVDVKHLNINQVYSKYLKIAKIFTEKSVFHH